MMHALSKRVGHVQRASVRATSSRAQSSARRIAQVLPTHTQTRSYSEASPTPSPSSASAPPPEVHDNRPGPSFQDQEAHMNSLFPPLVFPPEMAARMLTHASHSDAVVRHNARLSFIGRRVLQAYLQLFLASSPALKEGIVGHSPDDHVDRTLNTYMLGEFVAPAWGIGRVIKWTPKNTQLLGIVPREDPRALLGLPPAKGRSVGMYKVHGFTVQAIVGGVFHQHGGAVAHKLFHTRVLPHLLISGRSEGLHQAFHDHARAVCKRMGGKDAPLTASS